VFQTVEHTHRASSTGHRSCCQLSHKQSGLIYLCDASSSTDQADKACQAAGPRKSWQQHALCSAAHPALQHASTWRGCHTTQQRTLNGGAKTARHCLPQTDLPPTLSTCTMHHAPCTMHAATAQLTTMTGSRDKQARSRHNNADALINMPYMHQDNV
jgi:hypothetical protein